MGVGACLACRARLEKTLNLLSLSCIVGPAGDSDENGGCLTILEFFAEPRGRIYELQKRPQTGG